MTEAETKYVNRVLDAYEKLMTEAKEVSSGSILFPLAQDVLLKSKQITDRIKSIYL